MSKTLTIEELERLIGEEEIDTVLVAFPDMQGRLVGKRFTGRYFLDGAREETHACDYLLAADMEMEPVPGYEAASWDKGYGDFILKPDLTTLRRVPWLEGTALVLADLESETGELLPHAPRSILKEQLARLSERGWTACFASELEFYLYRETYEQAREKAYRNLSPVGWYIEDYHIFQTSKEESLIRAIRNGMEKAGIPVEASKGEWGPGQEEINFRYAEALEMADRHAIYKNGAKEIAFQHGQALTFMAKPSMETAGNSCHIHCSLRDRETNRSLFRDDDSSDGMSKTFRHFIAGQIALAQDYTLLMAPFVNSYKRFQSQSFAPTGITWSWDNRTTGFRAVGHGESLRIENRMGGADCNPYIAYAAMIAAGLYGIDEQLDLEPAYAGNAYESEAVPRVPPTLREAIDELDQSAVLREAFGDAVIEHYLHAARYEQADIDRAVTDYELRRMFERG